MTPMNWMMKQDEKDQSKDDKIHKKDVHE